jgi:hypothetical protein
VVIRRPCGGAHDCFLGFGMICQKETKINIENLVETESVVGYSAEPRGGAICWCDSAGSRPIIPNGRPRHDQDSMPNIMRQCGIKISQTPRLDLVESARNLSKLRGSEERIPARLWLPRSRFRFRFELLCPFVYRHLIYYSLIYPHSN